MSDRQRRYKQRKRLKRRVFRVEAHVGELSEALIEANLLAWDRAEDLKAIEAALGKAVRRMIHDEGDVSPGP